MKTIKTGKEEVGFGNVGVLLNILRNTKVIDNTTSVVDVQKAIEDEFGVIVNIEHIKFYFNEPEEDFELESRKIEYEYNYKNGEAEEI